MKKENESQQDGLRADVREMAAAGGSIEFRPSASSMAYQFGLRDWSDSGFGILVRNDSKILGLLKVGQVIAFKIHKPGGHVQNSQIKAEICHISDPEKGRHPDHKIVGLHIL